MTGAPDEKKIHAALAEAFANIWIEYGVRVDVVRAEWIDVTPVGGQRHMILRELKLETTTTHGGKKP